MPHGTSGESPLHRVLYGDRDADFASFLRERLEHEDERIRVQTTDSVDDILDAAESPVDCVLLGSGLAGSDSISILERIRERDSEFPVVLFTARGSESLASEAIAAGVTDYVVREPGTEQYQLLATRLVNAVERYRAQQRVQTADEQTRQIYERIEDAFYAVDEQWRVTYWNSRMAARTGVPAVDVLGEVVWEVFPEMVDSEVHARYHEAMATQEPVTFETYVEPLEYWTEVRVFPDESGLSIYSRDVTDQKREQRSLERQSTHLRRFHEITTDETRSFDSQLRALLALGRDHLHLDVGVVSQIDETYTVRAVDAPTLDLQAGAEFDPTDTICERLLEQSDGRAVMRATDVGVDVHPAYRHLAVDRFVGVPITVEGEVYGGLSFGGLDEQEGGVSEIDRTFVRLIAQWIGREIGRQRDRRTIQTSEQYLRSIIDALPQQVFVKASDGTYVLANESAADVYGITPAELEGASDEQYGKNSPNRDFRSDDQDVIESGEAKLIPEDTFVDAADQDRFVRTAIKPLDVPDSDERRALVVTTDITERKRLEQRLRALHEANRELTVAETVDEIGRIAVEAAADILEMPASGVWQYDPDEDALVPVADSARGRDVVGSQPTYEAGETAIWEAFERGERRVVEDTREADRDFDAEAPFRSGVLIPLGEYGLMATGSMDAGEFDDIDVDLLQVLGATIEAAMIRADRERQLRDRERELARQNERLDEFTSVVAHDLRNPLSIAIGMVDIARETQADDHFEKAEHALYRMERLIDDLLTLAREGETVEETRPVSLAATARESWGYVDTADADLVIETAADATIPADADRLTQLFENLFRNSIEHGGESVTVRIGPLDEGFYVEDTGAGIPADERDAVFDRGYTTNENGTGFGLSIVEDIAAAHGWTAHVTSPADGGARFEFRDRPGST